METLLVIGRDPFQRVVVEEADPLADRNFLEHLRVDGQFLVLVFGALRAIHGVIELRHILENDVLPHVFGLSILSSKECLFRVQEYASSQAKGIHFAILILT